MNFSLRAIVVTFIVSLAAALIAFALMPTADFVTLAKLLALALGITLLTPLWYPHVRGIRKGDVVTIEDEGSMLKIPSTRGVALTSGHMWGTVKVATEDGREFVCRIKSYAGTFSRARVVLEDREQMIEVR
ncbi:MAG: hypothetical protein N3H30_01545 [Candidatus Micrarchaeota archaeon]|nr:hypothetical protein [Candidatus Micrarchaeota archaeon]